jgi:hypothetical protein
MGSDDDNRAAPNFEIKLLHFGGIHLQQRDQFERLTNRSSKTDLLSSSKNCSGGEFTDRCEGRYDVHCNYRCRPSRYELASITSDTAGPAFAFALARERSAPMRPATAPADLFSAADMDAMDRPAARIFINRRSSSSVQGLFCCAGMISLPVLENTGFHKWCFELFVPFFSYAGRDFSY